MKTTVSAYDFERAFADMNRADNFSYEGKRALFEYLEQYGEDCGEEVELDVIALCCEYSEHDTALEAAREYGYEPEEEDNEREAVRIDAEGRSFADWLREATIPSWTPWKWFPASTRPATSEELEEMKGENENDEEEKAIDWLQDRTSVIVFDGGVIIEGF